MIRNCDEETEENDTDYSSIKAVRPELARYTIERHHGDTTRGWRLRDELTKEEEYSPQRRIHR